MRFEVVAMMMVHLFDEVEDWGIDDNVKGCRPLADEPHEVVVDEVVAVDSSVAAPAGTDFVIVECALSPSQNILDVFRISQKIKAKLSFKYYLVYVSKC